MMVMECSNGTSYSHCKPLTYLLLLSFDKSVLLSSPMSFICAEELHPLQHTWLPLDLGS